MVMDGNSGDISGFVFSDKTTLLFLLQASWTWLVVGFRENYLLTIHKSCQLAGTSYSYSYDGHFILWILAQGSFNFKFSNIQIKNEIYLH